MPGLGDVLHLHRLQRHHRLAGGDAVTRLDQNCDDAAVHGSAAFAVTIACGGRRCGEGEIGDRERDAAVLEIEPIAVAQEFALSVMAEADGVGIELRDLEPVQARFGGDGVAAVALTRDFELMHVAGNLDLRR